MEKYLLSCDWGSTSFRLRLIEMPWQRILDELFSEEGVIHTFTSWKDNAEARSITRNHFFLNQLKQQVTLLLAKASINSDHITVIISGMASSSIGLHEMPYAQLPFAIDGSNCKIEEIATGNIFSAPVLLISGVSTGEDVIRGEETQLTGIAKLLDIQQQEAIVILPGTHSKHLHIKNGELINIQTYITGELFSLMVNNSILKDSVVKGDLGKLADNDIASFKSGVKEASSLNVLNSLFKVRTNQLFNKLKKEQNFFYLSGLLIGTELNNLRKNNGTPLILCGGSNLNKLYELALYELEFSKHTHVMAAHSIEQATITGQIIIAQKNKLIN